MWLVVLLVLALALGLPRPLFCFSGQKLKKQGWAIRETGLVALAINFQFGCWLE